MPTPREVAEQDRSRRYRTEHHERVLESKRTYRDRKEFGGQREAVLHRDNYQCVKCGMTDAQHRQRYERAITIDHINGRGGSAPHALSNLQTLCLSCHSRKDNRRGENSQFARLTTSQALTIKALKGVLTQVQIGKRFGVSVSQVANIWHGRRWSHLSTALGGTDE